MSSKGAPLYVKIIVVVFIVIMAYFSIFNQQKKKAQLLIEHRYTIGLTQGASINHRSSKIGLNYVFRVSGMPYSGFVSLSSVSKIKTNGGEYIIMYDPRNPNNSRILLDKPVVFHPAVLDDTGWVAIPDYIISYGVKND